MAVPGSTRTGDRGQRAPQASPGHAGVGGSVMAGRVRVLGGFAAFGAFWGAWGATLPAIQAHAGVDDGQLGIALLCIGAGALASMRSAGTARRPLGRPGAARDAGRLRGGGAAPGAGDVDGHPVRRPARPGRGLGRGRRRHQRRGREHRSGYRPADPQPRPRHLLGLRGGGQPRRRRPARGGCRGAARARRSSASWWRRRPRCSCALRRRGHAGAGASIAAPSPALCS